MQLQHAIDVIYLCNMYVMRLHILEFTENTLKGLFQHRYLTIFSGFSNIRSWACFFCFSKQLLKYQCFFPVVLPQ